MVFALTEFVGWEVSGRFPGGPTNRPKSQQFVFALGETQIDLMVIAILNLWAGRFPGGFWEVRINGAGTVPLIP